MKIAHAVALLAAAPAFASASSLLVDFEHQWDYLDGSVNGYYAGGTAADGTSGANLGVSFTNVSGLSNDIDFTYYSGAPSSQGVAYAYDTAYLDIAGGVNGSLTLWYSALEDVTGAVQVWSGLDGTGTLLGTFDLTANSSSGYDTWTRITLDYAGVAQSFQFATGNYAFDNISAVPEAGSMAMMLAGVGLLAGATRRRRG
jgi:hypothetical protein